MKDIFRKKLIQQRKSLPLSVQHKATQKALLLFKDFLSQLHHDKNPQIIGGYYPIQGEINILPILDFCRQNHIITALPHSHKKNKSLNFHLFDGDTTKLVKDDFNILAPQPFAQPIFPDMIICPCVAVDTITSQRLGYGGGFYDRYAQQNSKTIFISVIFNFQQIDENLFEPHDLKIFHKIVIN